MTYNEKPLSITLIESIAWIILLFIIISYFFISVFNVNIINILADVLNNFWGSLPETNWMPVFSGIVNISITNKGNVGNVSGNGNCQSSVITKTDTVYIKIKDDSSSDAGSDTSEKEVFNIANNLYTYSDAKQVCSIFDSELATYKQIEAAYNKGAEWCNYGWSSNQMALFPTQYSTWKNAQTNKCKKNACGRPGINGGYFENPNLKFGVNCYGKKPKPSGIELKLMENKHIHPKTKEEIFLEERNIFWKNNSDKMLNITAFNQNSWSMY